MLAHFGAISVILSLAADLWLTAPVVTAGGVLRSER